MRGKVFAHYAPGCGHPSGTYSGSGRHLLSVTLRDRLQPTRRAAPLQNIINHNNNIIISLTI